MRKHSEETKEKMRQAALGRTQSKECRKKIGETRKRLGYEPWNKGLTKTDPRVAKYGRACSKTKEGMMSGRDNPNWKGGKKRWKKYSYPSEGKGRSWTLASRFHKKYFPDCEICGKKGEQVHHRDFKTTDHNPKNLQTLCRKCHKKVHNA